jgi:hypothetical protein
LFGPDIAARLMTFFTSSQTSQQTQAFPELTMREHEVLDLIAKGLNNQAIATLYRSARKPYTTMFLTFSTSCKSLTALKLSSGYGMLVWGDSLHNPNTYSEMICKTKLWLNSF